MNYFKFLCVIGFLESFGDKETVKNGKIVAVSLYALLLIFRKKNAEIPNFVVAHNAVGT